MIDEGRFARDFPREQWVHVRIVYDGRGAARFEVNGKLFGQGRGQFFNPVRKGPISLCLGPFVGLVDEVRLRRSPAP